MNILQSNAKLVNDIKEHNALLNQLEQVNSEDNTSFNELRALNLDVKYYENQGQLFFLHEKKVMPKFLEHVYDQEPWEVYRAEAWGFCFVGTAEGVNIEIAKMQLEKESDRIIKRSRALAKQAKEKEQEITKQLDEMTATDLLQLTHDSNLAYEWCSKHYPTDQL